MNSTDHQVIKLKKSSIFKHANRIVKLLIFLAFIGIIPVFIRTYHQQKGYIFPDNIGYISLGIYHRIDINEDVLLDKEETIRVDYVDIDDLRFKVIFTNSQVFDIGLPADVIHWGLTHFNQIHFLYGGPFSNPNEIVISESISLSLFNQSNSVGESIIINHETYTVTGVVANSNPVIESVFMEYSTLESVIERDWTYYNYRLFQDENLIMRLYDKGGIELVNKTITSKNQREFSMLTNISTNLVMICFGILNIFLYQSKNEDGKKRVQRNNHFIKDYIKLNIGLTGALLYGFLIFIIVFSSHTTYQFSFRYLTDQIQNYSWGLIIYTIPLIIVFVEYLNKKIKLTKNNL